MSTKKWEPPRPSTYTPFFRRFFVDEKAREVIETKQLYKNVTERFAASAWGDRSALQVLYGDIIERIEEYGGFPSSVKDQFIELIKGLLLDEDYLFSIDEPEWPLLLEEQVEIRAQLRHQEYFLTHKDKCADALTHGIAVLVTGIGDELEISDVANPIVTSMVPMYILLDTNDVIESIINTFVDIEKYGTFTTVVQQLYLNLCAVSNIQPNADSNKPFILPSKKKLEPLDAIAEYLHHTPFFDLLYAEVPFKFEIPFETYYEHTLVCGGPGSGKSSWLKQLILQHIDNPKRPSIVVMDSEGDIIPRLRTLKAIQDRVIYIDPTNPPSISLFDVNTGASQALEYLFGTILGMVLTPRQKTCFQFMAEVMSVVPQATMLDLMRLSEDKSHYQKEIDTLSEVHQQFFRLDYMKEFAKTRAEVRSRLHAILGNKTLNRMLNSPTTTFNMIEEIDNGTIILIDTSVDELGDMCGSYGQIFIFLLLRALYSRRSIHESKRHPTMFICDEAHRYFNSEISEMLDMVRKFKCGCTFAFQRFGQADQDVQSALLSSTSIKMASGVSHSDATSLAKNMGTTTADFILAQPKLTFATYVRNHTDRAISLPVTYGLLDKELHVILKKKKKKPQQKKQQPATKPVPKDTPQVSTDEPTDIDIRPSDTW